MELEIVAARPLAGGAARVTRAAVGFALMLTAIALGLVNIALLEAKPVNAGLPVVRSDFPACVTVHLEPLLRTPRGRLDYRLGKPSNDRGET